MGNRRRTLQRTLAIGSPPGDTVGGDGSFGDASQPPPPPPMRRTRLTSSILGAPRRVDQYFDSNLARQALWATIALGSALSVNDVVAAAVTVAFCEVVSVIYYSAPKTTLRLIFLNSFKMGVTAALIADALKLQS